MQTDQTERTLTPREIGQEIEDGYSHFQMGRIPFIFLEAPKEPKHLTVDQLISWLLRERGKGLDGDAKVDMLFDSGHGRETAMSVSRKDKDRLTLWSECSVLATTKSGL